MTNTELLAKIKAEIERRRDSYLKAHGKYGRDADYIAATEDLRLLEFLDTLELEKPVPKDLEEAAVYIADVLLAKPKDYALAAKADYWNGANDGVIAGAEWQKEQMMKGAVEMEVGLLNKVLPMLLVTKPMELKDFPAKQGDKVRVIVCKKEN